MYLSRAAFWIVDSSLRAVATTQLQVFALVVLAIRYLWFRPRQPASMQADLLQF